MSAVLLAVSVGAANADIIIATGNNPQTDENILFNEAGLMQSGTTVQGISNQTDFVVNFTSPTALSTPAQGQARIAAGTGTFTDLTVDLVDPTAYFTSLILNIDATAEGGVDFTVTETNGQQTMGSFALGASGENFFTITAVNGQRIDTVRFNATGNATVEDVAQVRIGGLATEEPNVEPIPEPGTMALMGGGLLLAGLAFRRKK